MTHPITTALHAAMMHSREPMVLSDPALADHPIVAINPAFEALSGYPAAETIGRNCRFLQGEGTDRLTTGRIARALAERRGCIEWVVNYRRNGERFWNLLFLSPVFAADGTLLHFFGNQRDITEGPPASLPDYTLGRAEFSRAGQREFAALIASLLETADPAQELERLLAAARALDRVSTTLVAPPWSPPAQPSATQAGA